MHCPAKVDLFPRFSSLSFVSCFVYILLFTFFVLIQLKIIMHHQPRVHQQVKEELEEELVIVKLVEEIMVIWETDIVMTKTTLRVVNMTKEIAV